MKFDLKHPIYRATIFNSVYFVEGMSFFLTLYILSNYLDIIGINSILIGVSGGIGTIPWVLKGIIGPLCDKFYIKKFGNRKQYIFVGAILSSIFFPLLIVTARPELLILFIFTWLIHNFGIILMDTNLDALCVETVPDSKDKTDANFWAFLGINLMGPIISTVFISQLVIIDYLFAFSVAGMISIVNIIIILFLREEKRETKFHKNITKNKQKIGLKLYFKQKFVLLSFIFSLFFTIHFGLLDLTLPIWLVGNLGIPINLLGYYQIFYGSMLLIGSICARFILRKIQKTKVLIFGSCANIIYFSFLFFLYNYLNIPLYLTLNASIGFFDGLIQVTFYTYFMEVSNPDYASTTVSLFASTLNFGRIVGIFLSGFFIMNIIFLLCIFLTIIQIIPLIFIKEDQITQFFKRFRE